MAWVLLSNDRSPWDFVDGWEMSPCVEDLGKKILRHKPFFYPYVGDCQSTYADKLGEERPLRPEMLTRYDGLLFNLDECLPQPSAEPNKIAVEVDRALTSPELLACGAISSRGNTLPADRWRSTKSWPTVIQNRDTLRHFLDNMLSTLYQNRKQQDPFLATEHSYYIALVTELYRKEKGEH